MLCELSEDFLVHERNIRPLFTKFENFSDFEHHQEHSPKEKEFNLWLALEIGDQKKQSYQSAKYHGMIEVSRDSKIRLQNWWQDNTDNPKKNPEFRNSDTPDEIPATIDMFKSNKQMKGDFVVLNKFWTGPIEDQIYCNDLISYSKTHKLDEITNFIAN